MSAKSIVLMTIDCLRANDVGCISECDLTPNLDRLGKDGIVFKNFISNGPGTPQAFPAIFTSTYALQHKKIGLSKRFVTLAEILSSSRFLCAGFHSNPFLSKFFGWDRGFHIYKDLLSDDGNIRYFKKLENMIFENRWLRKIIIKDTVSNFIKKIYGFVSNYNPPYALGDDLNLNAINWLKDNKGKRLFLWMHYMDVHEPFCPPRQFMKGLPLTKKQALSLNIRARGNKLKDNELQLLKQLYNAAVRYVDHCVGEFVDSIRDLHLLEDTVILIMADHGEAFLEHGFLGHPQSLYEELIHIPLIIYNLDKRGSVPLLAEHLDIVPTIMAIAGISNKNEFRGKNLLPIINGEDEKGLVISETAEFNMNTLDYNHSKRITSCRTAEWKLILNENQAIPCTELYNLYKDPNESINLKEEKDIVKELTNIIKNHTTWERWCRFAPAQNNSVSEK